MKQHRIEVHGKVEIWTECNDTKVKKNEFALHNFTNAASDVRLILDKETKENVDKFPGFRSDCKYLGEVIKPKPRNMSFDEALKLVSSSGEENKKHFLDELFDYELETGISRSDLYFNIFNDCASWGTEPLFESTEQIKKYVNTGKI